MSSWKGKYVIGLTGNIATGKSVVRKMLEHLGAYGIDADALSHRATAKGAPGYDLVLEAFGNWVVTEDGEIDRTKLGNLVFADAEALQKLEQIVHPLVRQAIDHLVKNSSQKVVVLEAIKLLESPLREKCDSIWVSSAPESLQLQRLTEKRGMDKAAAKQRARFNDARMRAGHAWCVTNGDIVYLIHGKIVVAAAREDTVMRTREAYIATQNSSTGVGDRERAIL